MVAVATIMLIKRAVGHPQLRNHRQEGVSESPRVHRSATADDRGRGGRASLGAEACRRRGAAGAARPQARERQEEPAQRRREAEHVGRDHHLQQLLRVRHRQGRAVDVRAQRSRPSRGRSRSTASATRRRTGTSRTSSKGQTLEERIYRHRCVEAWSMVIPWVGFPLADFIKKCEPTSKAKFVEFTTLYDPKQMPGARMRRAALAVRRRAAAGRGDAPADDPRRRPLRRSAAEPGRRAAAARRAVEVRLQARQVDRQDPVRREAAAEHVAAIRRRTSTASTRT